MKQRFILIAVLLAGFLSAGFAHAQAKGYAGAFVGLSVPDADDTSARPAYGILGGARLDGEFGIGAYYLTSAKKETIGNVKLDFDYSLYGLEGSFHFEGVAEGAYVGARVGLAKIDFGGVSFSPMTWGLHFGYDYFMSGNFSLGLEGGFMSVAADDNDSMELDSFTMMNFLVAAKMWF